MVTEVEGCERKRQLLQDLLQVFSRVPHIPANPVEIASQTAGEERSEPDGVLQRAGNEQRQAVQALENHQREHGC
jgi:hypothetical protein